MSSKLCQKKPTLYIWMMEQRPRKRKDKEKEKEEAVSKLWRWQSWANTVPMWHAEWAFPCWGQRSLFYLLSDLFTQVESSWGNQAVNWLIGCSFCAVHILWQGERMSWWVRLGADELVLFTSRGSAPLHFWGEITVYHLHLVRVVTALCHTLTWNFWGENGNKVDRK